MKTHKAVCKVMGKGAVGKGAESVQHATVLFEYTESNLITEYSWPHSLGVK